MVKEYYLPFYIESRTKRERVSNACFPFVPMKLPLTPMPDYSLVVDANSANMKLRGFRTKSRNAG